MKYRKYGNTGMEVSTFGLGCMRFPKIGTGDDEIIDQAETTKMIHFAIEQGVNYLDTAYLYPGSEVAVGKALEGGLREKVYIVGKNPTYMAKCYVDMEAMLDEELSRLQTDYIDVYFLHSLNAERWEHCHEIEALRFLDDMKAKGKIKFAGFSFHGQLPNFKEIVDAYDWDIVQVQLNFLDIKHQAGLEGMHYAAAKGLPVVIMEPLRGGALVNKLPEAVEQAYADFPIKRSPAEWSFRWLIDQPEVTSILSGVTTMEQLKENIRIFSETDEGCMSDEEQELIKNVTSIFKAQHAVGCTRCGYCMPCPFGVDIPEVFQIYNDSHMKGYEDHSKFMYGTFLVQQDNAGADRCTQCGKCEKVCPQNLPIIKHLQEAHTALTAK